MHIHAIICWNSALKVITRRKTKRESNLRLKLLSMARSFQQYIENVGFRTVNHWKQKDIMISAFQIINGSMKSPQDWIFCTCFRILVHVYFLPKWFPVMIRKHLLANPVPASDNIMMISKELSFSSIVFVIFESRCISCIINNLRPDPPSNIHIIVYWTK